MKNNLRLSIAVHALNNTANPEGLIRTLLVFGTLPKIPLGTVSHLAPNQKERFQAMQTARKLTEIIVARQRLEVASKTRTKSMEILDIPPGSEVLVYRERLKRWTGPFILKSHDDRKTAFVDTGNLI